MGTISYFSFFKPEQAESPVISLPLAEAMLVLVGLLQSSTLYVFTLRLLSTKEGAEGMRARPCQKLHFLFYVVTFFRSYGSDFLEKCWSLHEKMLLPHSYLSFPFRRWFWQIFFSGSHVCQNRLVRMFMREIWLCSDFQDTDGTDIANGKEMSICPALFSINGSPYSNPYLHFV